MTPEVQELIRHVRSCLRQCLSVPDTELHALCKALEAAEKRALDAEEDRDDLNDACAELERNLTEASQEAAEWHSRYVQAKECADEAEAREREACAKECDWEAKACMSHAKAFLEMHPKKTMPLHTAHEMAGNQSAACAHRIRARGKS